MTRSGNHILIQGYGDPSVSEAQHFEQVLDRAALWQRAIFSIDLHPLLIGRHYSLDTPLGRTMTAHGG